jgi:hydrogenase 3 maturation protease
MGLRESLEAFLGDSLERRVVLMGIGSPIRMDDAVGLHVIELLEAMRLDDVLLLSTEIVPEGYTGKVREFKPTHVLMVDAAHFNGEPGEGRLIPTQLITGTAISTHNMPLTILADYIEKSMCAKVALLGIQPIGVYFGEGLSPEVEAGAINISKILYEVLTKKY